MEKKDNTNVAPIMHQFTASAVCVKMLQSANRVYTLMTRSVGQSKLDSLKAVWMYTEAPDFCCGKVKSSATNFEISFPFADSDIFPSLPGKAA
jgi:hypothetical protein